jgi:hypothetical protein
MKNYFIIAYITAVCYIIGAFINWDGNAGNWSEFARFSIVLLWVFVCCLWATNEANK